MKFNDDRYRRLTENPKIGRNRKVYPSKETQKLINRVLELEIEEEG